MAPSSRPDLAGQLVSRRRLRRISRQFSAVGVEVPAGRLRQIAAGRPAEEFELYDIAFAEAAIRIQDQQRRARHVRVQKRCMHTLIVAGAFVIALNLLVCLGLAFFLLAVHTSPL